MTTTPRRMFNRRRHERYSLPPMYTSVTAHAVRNDECEWMGHAYDISESGARIELDDQFATGETIELRFSFPADDFDFRAKANVVRLFDRDDDPGPRRMGVEFTDFASDIDRQRLLAWLGRKQLLRAA